VAVGAFLSGAFGADGPDGRADGRKEGGMSRGVALPAFVVLALVSGACASQAGSGSGSGGSPSGAGSGAGQFPATVHAANGDVRIASRPTRVVSLSPTATEMLFAIGAGPQVVAVDDQSNYPPSAPMTKLSGYQPNVEAIAAYHPDLVVISYDPGSLEKSLQQIKIPVLLQPAANTLADVYTEIEQLGTVTGQTRGAASLVASMRTKISALVASAPRFNPPLTYYHELDQTYYTLTSKTFAGQLYAMVGLKNIADAAKHAASGYPQLSGEYIVKANPDIIFLADTKCCHQSASTVAKRPGWNQVAAVKSGDVVPLDDDVASRWGPRVVDFLGAIVAALQHVKEQEAA
jgi:iron complex transport system substrate-binding protein